MAFRLTNSIVRPLVLSVALVALVAPIRAGAADRTSTSSSSVEQTPGSKTKMSGVIIKREADGFVLQGPSGTTVQVGLMDGTKVEEKKSNPFRRAKNYATTELMRGLNVDVEGHRDPSGRLMADKIRFSETALTVAHTVESQVVPVEGRVSAAESRVSEAENRLKMEEENAQRLSGQVDELGQVSNAARGGAKAAQETADAAMAGVGKTNSRIAEIVSGLDEYDTKEVATVRFKASSAVLSDEAKASLDAIAMQAKAEKAFVIEVAGHASADGNADFNRRLSQHRADAVVGYLAEKHDIPLRRIVTPYGYGAMRPVGDNSSRSGREENRRVDVKVLINRGMTTSVSEQLGGAGSAAGSAASSQPREPQESARSGGDRAQTRDAESVR